MSDLANGGETLGRKRKQEIDGQQRDTRRKKAKKSLTTNDHEQRESHNYLTTTGNSATRNGDTQTIQNGEMKRKKPRPEPNPGETMGDMRRRRQASKEARFAKEAAAQEERAKEKAARRIVAKEERAATKEAARKERAPREEAAREEAAKAKAVKIEAAREEKAARKEAARGEAAKEKAARKDVAKAEAARSDAVKANNSAQAASNTGQATALIVRDPGETKTARKKRKSEKNLRDNETKKDVVPAVLDEQDGKKSSADKWKVSPPSAGRFLQHDPIFVRNDDGEDFLLSANAREMQLLSLDTSLTVRTHAASNGRSIKCYAMDKIDNNLLHIGHGDGSTSSWNWSDDVGSGSRITASGTLKAIASGGATEDEKSVLLHLSDRGDHYAVFNQDNMLFETTQQLHEIQILGNDDYIIVRGDSVVIIGARKHGSHAKTEFDWIELPLNTPSTCLDARFIRSEQNKKTPKQRPGLSLAVGNVDGQIHLFDDLSFLFRQQADRALPQPRILHWHREAVSSVKFSRDGNYLISGGQETVLVIWQLATGKKQYLPHLTSEIERIVVNPEGDRYALQMGDNSIMVLSTSELKPVANFAGLQLLSNRSESTNNRSPSPVAASLHPVHPNQLLLTVPSSQPKSSKDIAFRPFLQTFDTRTSRHVSRQALTRNNVTDFNIGPERTAIAPPDVKNLAVSLDGMWLATVDEWMPPTHDLQHLTSDSSGIRLEQQKRREVHLKIWIWDEEQALWTLTTRMDAPHRRATGEIMGAGVVLALVSDPFSTGFATVGEEFCVKIWRPKISARSRANGLTEWTCKRSIQILNNEERADSPMEQLGRKAAGCASMAYSTDGSILAVAPNGQDPNQGPVVYFINTSSGTMTAKSGLATDEITSIGFIERYLIAVSGPAAYVWDLVDDSLMYKIKLSSSKTSQERVVHQLSVNTGDKTFALLTPANGKQKACVQVYGVTKTVCLYRKELETRVETILAGNGSRGYTLLFADATVRTISPSGAAVKRLRPNLAPLESDQSGAAIEPSNDEPVDIDMANTIASEDALNLARQGAMAIDALEDDRPVVRPEQLADIFDVGQSFAMPPVKDMFHAVMDLFSRKAEARVQAVEA